MFTEQKVCELNKDNSNIKYRQYKHEICKMRYKEISLLPNIKMRYKEISLLPNIKSLSQKWVKYQCVHSLEIEYRTI